MQKLKKHKKRHYLWLTALVPVSFFPAPFILGFLRDVFLLGCKKSKKNKYQSNKNNKLQQQEEHKMQTKNKSNIMTQNKTTSRKTKKTK